MGHSGQLARSANQTKLVDKELGTPDLGHPFFVEIDANGKKQFKLDVVKEHFLKPKPVCWNSSILGRRIVTHVACGFWHLLVVARSPEENSGRVYSAGHNSYGKLGLGDETMRHELCLVSVSPSIFLLYVCFLAPFSNTTFLKM